MSKADPVPGATGATGAWGGTPTPTATAPPHGARVQRRTNDLPVLHLEPEIPSSASWQVVVDGLVAEPATWTIEDLHRMVAEQRTWDLHCVWGWTRPACRWEGVPAGRLLDAARPLTPARWVVVEAAGDDGSRYASCYALARARRCLLAWRLDGADLTPEHGWPLRLVPPPTKWAYKAVKWVTRLRLVEDFTPGFWEALVGDPHGDIPVEVLDHVDVLVRETGEAGGA